MKLRQIFWIAAIALSGTLVGCSSEYDSVPVNPSPILTATFPLRVTWSDSVSADESIYSPLTPAAENDVVYAAGRDGEVKAYELASGKLVGRKNLSQTGFFSSDKAQLSGGITLSKNSILVGSEKGQLYDLDQQSGDLNWSQTLPGELLAKPTVSQDKIAIQTTNSFLQLRSLKNGELIWQTAFDSQALTLRGNASPIIAYDRVITGSANGRLMAYSVQTGDLIWQQRISQPTGTNEIARLSDVIVSPQAQGNFVYAVAYNGDFGAFSVIDGSEFWRIKLSSTTPFLIDQNQIYVIDDQDQIIAISKENGKKLWTQSDLLNRRLTAPVMWNNKLFVGDFEGYLYEIDPNDGQFISKMKLNSSGLLTAPINVQGKLVIQAKNGSLMVLDAR